MSNKTYPEAVELLYEILEERSQLELTGTKSYLDGSTYHVEHL
jgi:hypothetical protein